MIKVNKQKKNLKHVRWWRHKRWGNYYTLLVATRLDIISNDTNDFCFIKLFSRKVLYAQVLVIPRDIVINTKPVQKQESSMGWQQEKNTKETVAMKLDKWNVISASNKKLKTVCNQTHKIYHLKTYFLLHPQGVSVVPREDYLSWLILHRKEKEKNK